MKFPYSLVVQVVVVFAFVSTTILENSGRCCCLSFAAAEVVAAADDDGDADNDDSQQQQQHPATEEWVLIQEGTSSHHRRTAAVVAAEGTVSLGGGVTGIDNNNSTTRKGANNNNNALFRAATANVNVTIFPFEDIRTAMGSESFRHFTAHSANQTCSADEHARPFNNQVRGVNLGGWMVLEPWITPSMFYQFLGGTENTTAILFLLPPMISYSYLMATH